ncbi:MAG TPA: purine-nucleoside phosphorylase [Chloroflexota bacterium]
MGAEAPFDPEAAARAVERGRIAPTVGLVLGSGLGELGERIEGAARTPFGALPGLPTASVAGHAGEVVVGRLAGQAVAAMRGRIHMYEGHAADVVARPVRLLRALGCTTLIVTNAAGGLNPAFRVGDLMAITDHVFLPGLAGHNPLIGQPGERFVSMVGAYDPALIELALAAAAAAGFELCRGVYAMVSGPSYETLAELRLHEPGQPGPAPAGRPPGGARGRPGGAGAVRRACDRGADQTVSRRTDGARRARR